MNPDRFMSLFPCAESPVSFARLMRPLAGAMTVLMCCCHCPAFADSGDTLRYESLPPPPYIPQGTIFVSPGGSDDTGDGSSAAPYRSIAAALSTADSGDVINCREGIYNEPEGVRFRRPGITLQSHPGEWAVIQAPYDNEETAIAVYLDVHASYTTLRRLDISGGYYYGVSTETRWDWGDPADRSGCSHILVEDCRIHDTGRDCIKIKPNCDFVTIRRCEIYNSGRQYPPGETEGNAEGVDNVNGDWMLVQDCHVHDIFSTGIYFKGGAAGGVVERCRIENCGAGGVMAGFDTSPEYFDTDINPRYYENIYGIVRNCMITGTRYAGIGLYAARGARILNNTIIDAAREGHAALYFGVPFQDWEPDAGRPPCVDVQLVNNLVIVPRGSDALACSIRYTEELGGLSALSGMPVMDHNLYFHAGGTVFFEDNRPESLLDKGTLAEWRAHIQGEAHSMEADPMLDREGYPSAAGPAAGAGITHALVAYDLNQNSRTGLYDIGACETTGAADIPEQHPYASVFDLAVYPNPLNSRAVVIWRMPEKQTAAIGLYDITGKRSRILAEGLFESGVHRAVLGTDDLCSGLYFIRLLTGRLQYTRKLILVK